MEKDREVKLFVLVPWVPRESNRVSFVTARTLKELSVVLDALNRNQVAHGQSYLVGREVCH
jgi:hypothetical protein